MVILDLHDAYLYPPGLLAWCWSCPLWWPHWSSPPQPRSSGCLMLTPAKKVRHQMIFNSLSFQHLILATMYFEKVWLAGVIHAERFGKRYHFSWLEAGPNTKWDWEGARNYCRKFCMDSIAINSVAESKWVKNLIRWKISSLRFLTKSIRSEELHYIWTGGRKCNFKGCDRKDLQPAIQNGW